MTRELCERPAITAANIEAGQKSIASDLESRDRFDVSSESEHAAAAEAAPAGSEQGGGSGGDTSGERNKGLLP